MQFLLELSEGFGCSFLGGFVEGYGARVGGSYPGVGAVEVPPVACVFDGHVEDRGERAYVAVEPVASHFGGGHDFGEPVGRELFRGRTGVHRGPSVGCWR